jgi:HTH-type transcriptional regulator / antitoxin HigA
MATATAPRDTFRPDYAIPPGETLADLLEERDMTQTELAQRLGVSPKHINQVINGAASISAELALGLEKVFSVSAGFWLSRESLYQASVARREEQQVLKKAESWAKRFPIAELKKREFLPTGAKGSELVEALLQFLGTANPRQWDDLTVSFRKSQKFASDTHALWAWLRVGELRAAEIDCEQYDPDEFLDALESVRPLTRLDPRDWEPQLVEACAAAGVAVVVVDTFTGARVNGATRWLSPTKALVQLSLRHRWEDVFWFTFFHEAGHVLLHRKKDVFIEEKSRPAATRASAGWLQVEREADRFASRALIPPKYERRLHELTVNDIVPFAERLGIAPAIVVGRLQHERVIPHSHGNQLRRRLTFVAD